LIIKFVQTVKLFIGLKITSMKKANILILIAAVLIVGSACEKFSDGGPIRNADKNLQNSWELQKYNRNGTDETSLIFISGYSEEYSGGGVYSRNYINKNSELVTETGNWELESDNMTIHISNVSSIQDFSENNSTLSSSTYIISKLKKDEFWYYFENGGDTHLFKFILK